MTRINSPRPRPSPDGSEAAAAGRADSDLGPAARPARCGDGSVSRLDPKLNGPIISHVNRYVTHVTSSATSQVQAQGPGGATASRPARPLPHTAAAPAR